MGKYLASQAAATAVVLLVSSFIIFASLFIAPGSPEAVLFGTHVPDPAVRKAVVAKYHLDDPFLARYGNWLKDVAHGDFGTSIAYGQSVSERIRVASGTTFYLVVYAGALIILVGVGLGIVSALRPGRTSTLITILLTIGVAVPTFVMGMLLISEFAVKLGWFPVYGAGSGLADRIWHLTLPAIALACWASALLARVTRASMLGELQSEHVETARSRGLPSSVIVRRHVFRNALIPITTVAGLEIAGLIAGTVIVEQVFGLHGLGQLLVTAVNQKDFPTVQAACLIMVAAFVLLNVLVDVLYRALDPRIRIGGGAQ